MTSTPTPTSRSNAFQRHPRTTIVLVVVVGIAAILVVGELVARAVIPQWAPVVGERVAFWQYDSTLGWAHEPGQYGRLKHPDFDIDVRVNTHGLRDDEYPFERTPRRRLLVLGDSFGWGFGVEHHERFSEIIERARPGWEVINASVSGYGTDQELLYLRGPGLRFAPDAVLLLFHENDFHNNTRGDEYWYSKPYFKLEDGDLVLCNVPVPPTTLKQRCNRFFYGRTYLFARIYAALGGLTREARRPRWANDAASGDDGRHITAALLAEMTRVCEGASAHFVVASVPMEPDARRELEVVCSREGVPFLSLAPAFESESGGVTFEHDGHWTAEGHRRAALAIDAFLEMSGVFDSNSNR